MVQTFKFYTVPVRMDDVKKLLNQRTLSSKHVSFFFLPRKYDVISQLRHNYAKGPFCMARLTYQFLGHQSAWQLSLLIL